MKMTIPQSEIITGIKLNFLENSFQFITFKRPHRVLQQNCDLYLINIVYGPVYGFSFSLFFQNEYEVTSFREF